MIPCIFTHRDTDQQFLCTTDRQIKRFFDNRNPAEWMQWPASPADIRRWR